jgi:nickel transport protein
MKKILILSILPILLFGHKITLSGYYEDNAVFVEGFFSDGTPCKECKVTIVKDDKVVIEGKTDNEGVFEKEYKSLILPVDVKLDAGVGHFTSIVIEPEEDDTTSSDDMDTQVIASIDKQMIRDIVKSELKKQTAQIEAIYEKNNSNLDKIISGLGYILGIFGLWQLLAKRD